MLGPLRARLPWGWLVLGCLLPDLIDKPLYYLVGASVLIAGTRTFGHTGIFLLLLLVVALVVRRPAAWAVFAGTATHFVLDIGGEPFSPHSADSSIWLAIFWPAFSGRFPVAHYATVLEHLEMTAQSEYVIAGEIIGGAILMHAWWKRRQSV